ncbi:MAG: NYN domain-containing protein [Chloroflexota bacterium]|nr:NYN domain-containing protein [Chloroflexota bacterium]
MAADTHSSRQGDNEVTPKEVAVFIDFENIRYSTINSFGREPDPLTWRDKALQYGLMSVARAYADFDQHPPHVRTRLDVAGFELHHYPVKRSRDSTGRDKLTSRSDLNLVIDIINTALVRPDIEIFLLFTGDKDFIRLVTSLRNRLGKRVVICGVPGSISPDLVAAAGEEDTIEMTQSADVDVAVIQAIDTYIKQLHEGFVPTQSHMSRTLWRFLDRNRLPSEHIEAKVMEFLRKGILTKRQTINGQGQELVTTELNVEHPLVNQAMPNLKNEQWADDDRDEDYVYEEGDEGAPGDESVVAPASAGIILEAAPTTASVVGNGVQEPAEPVRYQRRFTTGNGAWRGRSNVRGDNAR